MRKMFGGNTFSFIVIVKMACLSFVSGSSSPIPIGGAKTIPPQSSPSLPKATAPPPLTAPSSVQPLPRPLQTPPSPEVSLQPAPYLPPPSLPPPQPDTSSPIGATPWLTYGKTRKLFSWTSTFQSVRVIFYWDKERLSAKDFQQNYCSLRCDGEKRIDLKWVGSPSCFEPKCISCICNRPSCEIYDLCCPDISEPKFDIKTLRVPVPIPTENFNDFGGFGETTTLAGENLADIANHDHKLSTSPAVELVVESATSNDTRQETQGHNIDKWSTQSPTEVAEDRLNVPKEPTNSTISRFHHNSSMSLTNRRSIRETAPQVEEKSSTLKLVCDAEMAGILYIRSCPRDFSDSSISFMCEKELALDEITEASQRRVYDGETGVIYYNEYCAKCNGVIELVPWELRIYCFHNMYVYQATSGVELLRLSLRPGSDCKVTQLQPPNAADISVCNPAFFSDNIIDKCNVTGLWPAYDEDVKQACEGGELSSLAYRVSENEETYFKNIFCSLCNSAYHPSFYCENRGYNPPHVRQPAFSLLLGFRRSASDYENQVSVYRSPFTYSVNCSDNEWPSPNGHCLPLQCSPGKVLNGTKCITALDTITGLGYKLQLWFVPDENSNNEFAILDENNVREEVLGSFRDQILSNLRGALENYVLIFSTMVNISLGVSNAPYPPPAIHASSTLKYELLYSWVAGDIIANSTFTRDAFENKLVDDFLNNSITIQFTEGKKITLKPSAALHKLETQDHCLDFPSAHATARCVTDLRGSENSYFSGEIIRLSKTFLKATNVLTCSFISFHNATYNYTVTALDVIIPPTVSITLNLQVTNITFSEVVDFNHLAIDNDGTLKICHELLDKKLLEIDKQNEQSFYRNSKFKSQSDTSTFAQYILTLICMAASMICLALTLLTYFRFSVLRSVAGRNNIFLCASLLLAQAMLLAAAHVSGPSTLCTALGIATHFLWLNMFCWSFSCCFHMFRVFTAKTRNLHSTARSQTMQLLKSVVLSVLVPGLVIATVIVASLFTSDKSEIGYGDNACYLDSNVLVGVSMIAPLALVTVCNMTFFTITVIKIHNVRKLQTHDSFNKEDRQNLYIYIKLSSLTGSFWAIFIIAEAVDVDSLRFVAIVLNGLQGVFIFISYISNKRIVNLYLRSLGLKTLTTTSSEKQSKTDRSTLGRLGSEIHQKTKTEKSRNGRCDEVNGEENQLPISVSEVDLEVDTEKFRNGHKSSETSSGCYYDPSLSNGTRSPADGSDEGKMDDRSKVFEDVADIQSNTTPEFNCTAGKEKNGTGKEQEVYITERYADQMAGKTISDAIKLSEADADEVVDDIN